MNANNHNSPRFTQGSIQAVIPTDVAAAALNRKPQTLRKWACLENGPIRPVRINGRLAWRVSDIQALLSGEVVQ
ncbi:helix-turn-helix domain-containing protein [Caballeronia sp. LZ025]|uniref:helix-turn-helix domain-containing protein n=1 Tax=Caballeronia TaxID=1827195 RepID=UPI001FD2C454|nr:MULTISPECIES: helix-turn-helix domain-containing protein [Caballeronia]MDR5733312.1 helix-turn-helix domain-containing protein [Caballeronia sp. LZ025]